MAEPGVPLAFDPEKLTEPFVDDDYEGRRGYDENFLGLAVPLPRVTDTSVVAEMDDGSGHVIPYEHFSVVLHKRRRLALLTASNIDGSAEAKRPEEGPDYSRRGLSGLGPNDHEKWVLDPRVGASAQLPDRFYTKDRGNFDKGHVVRRDDVAWGASFAEVRRANGDTYHVTNCSPQVDAFNRSNKRGDWGRLENNVLKQAKAEKLCVFAGPVLDDENDRIFRGQDDDGAVEVQIPSVFWKLVVARKDGELQSFAFLLEQDLSESDVEFNVDAEWAGRMIAISDLENLVPDLDFGDAVRDADQFEEEAGESVREESRLERYDRLSDEDEMGPARGLPEGPTLRDGNAEWNDETSPRKVVEAFKRGDRTEVGRVLEALRRDLESTGRLIDARAAKKTLTALRNYVWFDQLELMAETFEKFAQDDPQVLLHLAQARIELGEITQAVGGLLELKARIEEGLAKGGLSPLRKQSLENLLGEAIGLLGRCYKQFYVNAKPSSVEPRAMDLETSLANYGDAYERRLGDFCWHGINYVALLTHKKRVAEDKFNALSDEARRRAREILDYIDEKKTAGQTLQPWDLANRIEANLAVGETPAAIEATKAYLDHPGTDAFAVQSTRRQLIEIWLLTEDRPPGDKILPMMNARFAELGGTAEVIEIDPGQWARYEKVYGETKYHSLRWLQQAFSRSMSVARIGSSKFDGDGTGFLFDGAWISDAWAGKPLLLTNAHVCSNDPVVREQYPYPSPPEDLTAAFLGSGSASDAEELEFEALLWTSAPTDLDATLLLLKDKPPEGYVPPPKTHRKPPVTLKGDARLNILGHPKGLDMRISLQDNKTVEVGEKYVHYQTPTDPGSSGSPVFNQKWELVALHHASSREKKANEGIRIDVIIDAIQRALT